MKVQQTANNGKQVIVTWEDKGVQIELAFDLSEAERLCDMLTAEIQELLRARRANIGIGL